MHAKFVERWANNYKKLQMKDKTKANALISILWRNAGGTVDNWKRVDERLRGGYKSGT